MEQPSRQHGPQKSIRNFNCNLASLGEESHGNLKIFYGAVCHVQRLEAGMGSDVQRRGEKWSSCQNMKRRSCCERGAVGFWLDSITRRHATELLEPRTGFCIAGQATNPPNPRRWHCCKATPSSPAWTSWYLLATHASADDND